MIGELGLFALVVALLVASLLVIIPTIGLYQNKPAWIAAAPFYAQVQFVFVLLSYACLTICFLQDDFSLRYVLANSSVSLPWIYKVCAVWGGHEGSMLLWVAILSFWIVAVSVGSRSLDMLMRARLLVALGGLSIGFILFLLSTSNPFARQFQVLKTVGRDLNPLLQDLGFLFHPPMLYMGYVGFSVAFAFAISTLWIGRVETAWEKWTRPWTLAAWCCLTAGITLGSWWAYRELGWGGWWFWDPVENASFMPWLVGTALLHSLAASEQRQQLKAWTLLLAIIAFSLSLVGTFLVRSGVLTSVHAFAVDPQRGLYILGFLLAVIGGSFLLFALRAPSLGARQYPAFCSRDSALLLNNVFLMVLMLTVLLGTIYPLIIDGLGLGKLSVGSPYFNSVFLPLSIPLLLLMGLGIHLNWRQDTWLACYKKLRFMGLLSVLLPVSVLLICVAHMDYMVLLGLILACWIIFSTLKLVQVRTKQRGFKSLGRAFYGMILAHMGVAVSVIGMAVSTGYGVQEDVKLSPGESVKLAGYTITLLKESALQGANYHGTQVHLAIQLQQQRKLIYPEKRIYDVGQMALTEAAIDVNPFRDIYVALGEPLPANAWSVRLYYKPLVRWIWGGGFMILAGGLCALADRHYYQKRIAARSDEESLA